MERGRGGRRVDGGKVGSMNEDEDRGKRASWFHKSLGT